MRRIAISLVLMAGLCSLVLITPGSYGGSPPTVYSAIEGQDTRTGAPILVLIGTKLTKFTEFTLTAEGGEDAGGVTLVLKGKSMLVLGLPNGIEAGTYTLRCMGKKGTHEAEVSIGNLCFGSSMSAPGRALAVKNTADRGVGILGETDAVPPEAGEFAGVYGRSTDCHGVLGQSTNATGVYGVSDHGAGVSAASHNGQGLSAYSGTGEAIHARNLGGGSWTGYFEGGRGIYVEGQVSGNSTTVHAAIFGNSLESNGVYGKTINGDGVKGESHSQDVESAAVYGIHVGKGRGAFFTAAQGDGIHARTHSGGAYAGYFEGGKGIWVDGQVETGGADFAESVQTDRPASDFSPGDVIAIDPEGERRFSLCRQAASMLVAGVYSTKPGILGGAKHATDEIPMAITGIVPVKVCGEGGAIRAGDLLVTASVPGHAKKAPEHPKTGTVLGKALESFMGETGKIEVLISLR
jgi:hypothetical protein